MSRAAAALEKRFGRLHSAEAMRTQFANLTEGEEEGLREFADRVRGVTYAGLPLDFVEKEMIRRCHMTR